MSDWSDDVARAIVGVRDRVRRAMFPPRKGRPRGSRATADVPTAYREAVVAIRRRRQVVSLQAIAAEMFVGLTTLKRWREELDLPYPPPDDWRSEISD